MNWQGVVMTRGGLKNTMSHKSSTAFAPRAAAQARRVALMRLSNVTVAGSLMVFPCQ
jgi:hypothetical protein